MQVSLENLGKLERRLTVRISTQAIEAAARERVQELGKSALIKGFRTGKIPSNVLNSRFGAQARNDSLAAAISSTLQEAIRSKNLRPAFAPSIKVHPTAGDHVDYTADFEVFPEIETLDLAALMVEKCVARVEEADVDRRLALAEEGAKSQRDIVRNALERELADALASRTKTDVLRQLCAAFADLGVPKGLVEREKRMLLQQTPARWLSTDVQLSADVSAIAAEAEFRVRVFILLTEIARQNAIAPDQERISATLAEIAAAYDEPEKVVELYIADSELMASLRNQVIEDQTIEWVLANAQVTERQLSFSELVHAHPTDA